MRGWAEGFRFSVTKFILSDFGQANGLRDGEFSSNFGLKA